MVDAAFADPRMARHYDALDPDRSDLDVYAALVDELGARQVLDIGCGTGTFACLLARRGVQVIGVDPAAASVDLARAKPGAERVRWFVGETPSLPPMQVDLAVMTANVAQVFVDDRSWRETLAAAYERVRPGGHLVLETRVPAYRAWESWVREQTYAVAPAEGVAEAWQDLLEVAGDPEAPSRAAPLLVTFRGTMVLDAGERLESTSTLRFRSRGEVETSLADEGWTVDEVRDAPDRPGREWVFLARRGER
ncbi:class I SAM-dependent methyltransferase [Luteipulveratus sp. YIM 133132]|uniref:Class I SAM-dependent methyltransferase n=1 Tax=Luteipulveratus flavus TaxID=3031728 RepID=A0ABT6C8D9_9MICO|nr:MULTISPECIES: class I SAM-dependent methyltransferase [unclassified Luteipulveratus]MDE9364106.1 class I SAM-dependent methyltransferase [Luteipulveratus sp. YIM 133132]MDF8264324.1 class I SAM-dependent methyltransferase [Luteipulveratus sp. YIM 133296]